MLHKIKNGIRCLNTSGDGKPKLHKTKHPALSIVKIGLASHKSRPFPLASNLFPMYVLIVFYHKTQLKRTILHLTSVSILQITIITFQIICSEQDQWQAFFSYATTTLCVYGCKYIKTLTSTFLNL